MAPRPTPVTWSLVVAAVAVVLYAVLPLQGEYSELGLAVMLVLIALSAPLMWRTLLRVDRSDRPVVEAVAFLIALGTVAIVLPAAVYVTAATVSPGSFADLETKVDGVYFTVTVLSTVGFGDIHPVSQGARILTTAHILLSVVVLGTSVRLLTRVAGLRASDRWRREQE